MKKLFIITALVLLSIPAFNQVKDEGVLTNKYGVHILPEKGDISIGIDAVPFLNLLNNKGTSPGFNFVNNIPSISLKYFNSDNSALIMDILIGYTSFKEGDDNLSDFSQQTESSIGLNFGYEKRLGKTRVQGFYGLEGSVGFGKSKEVTINDIVTLETSSFELGASFIMGVEYFIAPKLSIRGKFSWGPQYRIEKDLDNESAVSGLYLGADNANGALILAFHF
jgi:hypothetical protein